jgi:hypothetical protein
MGGIQEEIGETICYDLWDDRFISGDNNTAVMALWLQVNGV